MMRRRADEAAVLGEGVEVEGEVGEGSGENAAGGAAGKVTVEAVAGEHAAAVLVDAARCRVIPAGARCTPGRTTRPLTEKERSPLRPRRPWAANALGPCSSRSRTQCRLSRLCSRVGRPKRPRSAR